MASVQALHNQMQAILQPDAGYATKCNPNSQPTTKRGPAAGAKPLDIYAAPGQGPAARRVEGFSSVILTRIPKGIPPHPGLRISAAGLLKIGLFWCVLSLVQPGAVLTSKVVPKGSQERS